MKVLVVVDMQNDFVDAALGSPEAAAIVPAVCDKIKNFDGKIIFTRDTHDEDYLNTNEGKHLPVEHCIFDTEGWKIHPDLDIADCEHIDKPNFGWPSWISIGVLSEDEQDYVIDYRDLEDIEIVGLCTDICVVSNALILKAFYPWANITVDASCCAGVTPESHKAALTTMKMCQINVIGE